MRFCLLAALLFYIQAIFAQSPTQRITGVVIDRASQQPLIGATVFIKVEADNNKMIGSTTDTEGRFLLEGVPVGRYFINCSYVGYHSWVSAYQEVTSGRKLDMRIELDESITFGDSIVVRAPHVASEASNEYGLVSARSFTPEETQRFAGSINDPGRMALSLPGAQISTQDNENTIVVRANSPIGLIWRLEGVEIPNPNHFAEAGSSGGGISALSIYVLGASDFFTGAFPAEYGNALSGIMDLKFRKGNREDREFRVQAGLIGLEFASEGPLSKEKKNASYLFNYRYSTLGILSQMGINVVNPLTSNTFQDLSFNLYFPLNKKSHLTFFGFGGTSAERKNYQEDQTQWESFNEVYTYDLYTNLGVTGLTYTYLIDDKSYLTGTLSVGANDIKSTDDTVSYSLERFNIRNERYRNGRVSTAWSYNTRVGKGMNLKTGFQAVQLFYNVYRNDYDNVIDDLRVQMGGSGNALLLQPYAVMRAQVTPSILLQGGINTLYFSYTNEFKVEPRLGAQFQFPSGSVNVAYGLHSQTLPFQTYEAVTTDSLTGANPTRPNTELSMWRAHHLAVNVTRAFAGQVRLKVEPYYQYLFDVPVSLQSWNTYSLINQDRNFFADSLSNAGTGYNAGVEVTLEKAFSNRLFFLLSGAVYDSRYKTNNGGEDKYYNTKYNSNFNSALTFGKEWELKKGKRMEAGGRVLYSGGMRYTPFDTQKSIETGRAVYIQSQAYEEQNKNYFRVDARIALRKNAAKFSWKLSLDIQNLTNYQNPQRPYYDRWTGTQGFGYNTSIIPVISYTIDF